MVVGHLGCKIMIDEQLTVALFCLIEVIVDMHLAVYLLNLAFIATCTI